LSIVSFTAATAASALSMADAASIGELLELGGY
jgi:hypothetical protein